MREKAQTLSERGLRRARVPLAEGEGDLRNPEPGGPDDDLKENLETAGLQNIEVEGGAANEEEAAHRVRNGLQPTREGYLGDRCGSSGQPQAGPAERSGAPLMAEPACDDQIALFSPRLDKHATDRRGRMLKVGIHDADPGGPCRTNPRHHSPAETTASPGRLTVNEADIEILPIAKVHDRLGRAVVAVVDEDNLRRQVSQGGVNELDKRSDVAELVPGRHDDRQLDGEWTEPMSTHRDCRCRSSARRFGDRLHDLSPSHGNGIARRPASVPRAKGARTCSDRQNFRRRDGIRVSENLGKFLTNALTNNPQTAAN